MPVHLHDPSIIQIRRATEEDFVRLIDMINALAAFNADKATIKLDDLRRDLLGKSPWVILLVAKMQNELIGYAALCPLTQLQFGKRGIDIHHLYVEAGYRRQGVGAMLIAAAIKEATELGCSFIKIAISAENQIAQKAYIAAGFELETVRGAKYKMVLEPVRRSSSF